MDEAQVTELILYAISFAAGLVIGTFLEGRTWAKHTDDILKATIKYERK